MYDAILSLNPYFAARDRRLQWDWPNEPQQVAYPKLLLDQSQNAGDVVTPVARFALGQIVYSDNATLRLRTEEVLTALRRHAEGNWGDLLPEDAIANELALKNGGRLFSAYGFGDDHFWVITKADRSLTVVLLPTD